MIIHNITISNFGSFTGKHFFEIEKPGLYYVRGINKIEPELGSNGAGKTTLFNALYWAWTGRTLNDRRPGAAIEPWIGKGSTVVIVNFGKSHFLRRSRNPNELLIDDKVVSQEEVDEYLGMSSDNLSRTLIIGQEAEHFLDLTAEQQSQMFTDMLNLEVWIGAAKVASERAREAASKAQLEENKAAERKGAIEALKDRLKQEKKAHSEFAVIHRQQLDELDDRLADFDELLERHIDTKPKITKTKVVQLTKEFDILNKEHVEQTRMEDDNRSELQDYQRSFKATEKMIEKYENNLDRDEEDVRCPECDQVISYEKVEDRLKVYKDEEEKLIRKIGLVSNKLKKIHEENVSRASKLFSLKDQVDKEKMRERENIIRLENWLQEKNSIFQNQERSKHDLEKATQRKNPHKDMIEQIQNAVEKNQQDYDDFCQAAEKLHWRAEACRFWVDAFREIRLNLIDDTILEIEVAANRHAMLLGLHGWGIKFTTEKVSKSDHVSRAFTATINPPDKPAVRWQSYSGGESQRWRWATTFALSEVLLSRAGMTFNLEVLDEPTMHLSQAGIDGLIGMLRDRAEDLKRAIYFIDHRNLDRGAFDGVIEIERGSKGSFIR